MYLFITHTVRLPPPGYLAVHPLLGGRDGLGLFHAGLLATEGGRSGLQMGSAGLRGGWSWVFCVACYLEIAMWCSSNALNRLYWELCCHYLLIWEYWILYFHMQCFILLLYFRSRRRSGPSSWAATRTTRAAGRSGRCTRCGEWWRVCLLCVYYWSFFKNTEI